MVDWSNRSDKKFNESGNKAHQREDNEDRIIGYRALHRTFSPLLCVQDIDQAEYRIRGKGMIEIVGLLEVTRCDYGHDPGPWYPTKIIDRLFADGQAKFILKAAENIGTSAYVVLYIYDVKDIEKIPTQFWVYNLTKIITWTNYPTPKHYEKWLLELSNEEDIIVTDPKIIQSVKGFGKLYERKEI